MLTVMTSGSRYRPSQRAGKTRRGLGRRDRRGRGLRGQLLPPTAPAARNRAQVFDELVLDTVERLERRWSAQLRHVEFAVEDVPPDLPAYDSDVVEDGSVPLARLLSHRALGDRSRSRIIIYRWPLEARSHGKDELAELIHGVITEQLANLFGVDPDDLD